MGAFGMAVSSNQVRFWGKFLRSWGKTFEGIGTTLQGNLAYTEKMGKHRTSSAFEGVSPSLSNAFVAPSASVVDNVELGASSSVWYGAVLRGDVNHIKIGANSHIGDRTVVHVASESGAVKGKAAPTIIGDGVNVGALAILHACSIKDNATIGIGAQVLDGATVGEGAVIEAGSIVSPGKTIPAGEVWGGVPAKMLRKVSPDEADALATSMDAIADLAKVHQTERWPVTWQSAIPITTPSSMASGTTRPATLKP